MDISGKNQVIWILLLLAFVGNVSLVLSFRVEDLQQNSEAIKMSWFMDTQGGNNRQGYVFMASMPQNLNIGRQTLMQYCGDYVGAIKKKRLNIPDSYSIEEHLQNHDNLYYETVQGHLTIRTEMARSGNRRRMFVVLWSDRCIVARTSEDRRSLFPHYEQSFLYYMLHYYQRAFNLVLVAFSNNKPCDYGDTVDRTVRQCSQYVRKLGCGLTPFHQRFQDLWRSFVYVSVLDRDHPENVGYLDWQCETTDTNARAVFKTTTQNELIANILQNQRSQAGGN